MDRNTIIVSFIINLIAAFVWWLLFIMIGGKKKNDYLITVATDCARHFECSVDYSDYDHQRNRPFEDHTGSPEHAAL